MMNAARCDSDLRLTSAADESPDWGYARSRRSVLMTTSAEWSQSLSSCSFESDGKRLIAPNRDSPYEGLLVHQDGENWKFIDCIAVGLRQGDGAFLPLAPPAEASAVTLDPWQVTYAYRAGILTPDREVAIPLHVSYYLASRAGDAAATGSITFYIPRGAERRDLPLTLVVQPFLDIRHMYSGPDVAAYHVYPDERGLLVVRSSVRDIVFYLPPGKLNVFGSPEPLDWHYKLGTGYRQEILRQPDGRMETRFIPEERRIAALFNLEAPVSAGRLLLRLSFQCDVPRDPSSRPAPGAVRGTLRQARRDDRDQLRTIESVIPLRRDLPFRGAILARIVGLIKLKIRLQRPDGDGCARVPIAGGWWFKTPWYRDVFEGILSSFDTLMRLPEERANLREVLDVALSSQNESNGLVPARIPEYQSDSPPFNSADATLLCLLAAHAYAAKAGDVEFGGRAIGSTLKAIARFREHYETPSGGLPHDGPPRLDPTTGLLLCVPHHSWIDTSRLVVEYAGWRLEGLSNRASARFAKDLYDRLGSKQAVETSFATASFFMPEINAQWISVLAALLGTFDLAAPGGSRPERAEVAALLERAREHFKPLFWNPACDFLFNLVHESRELHDAIECETAITAAALLGGSLFTPAELRSLWRHTEKTLLVHRTLQRYGSDRLPFGLLAKNDDQRIYYGDDQYHADVIWPRSTPYLVHLLGLLGEAQTARSLLINSLDHQMDEAALFYNQELFSRPCGNNPAPDERTRLNPVPVKNPIQFWSQWCDGYLRFFGEENAP
jgi:hypothetical protein